MSNLKDHWESLVLKNPNLIAFTESLELVNKYSQGEVALPIEEVIRNLTIAYQNWGSFKEFLLKATKGDDLSEVSESLVDLSIYMGDINQWLKGGVSLSLVDVMRLIYNAYACSIVVRGKLASLKNDIPQ